MESLSMLKDVDESAVTVAAYQKLLHEAATYGSVFDPDAIEEEAPNTSMNPGTSQTNEDNAVSGTQCDGPSGSRKYDMGDDRCGPVATQEEEDVPAAVVIGLEKDPNNFLMEVALMNAAIAQRIPPTDAILQAPQRGQWR
ncbi:hypothetical protein F5887DRAFT_917277 [Amanita rubescens]|nr:hypothetical protein F5887DRAFT_917277 [Amanita rubescens]